MIISGQITVTTAGTAVQGSDIDCFGVFIKALPTNTGVIYLGNVNGDITTSNGFPLSAGEVIYLEITNLSHLWFDASVNSQKIAWLLST